MILASTASNVLVLSLSQAIASLTTGLYTADPAFWPIKDLFTMIISHHGPDTLIPGFSLHIPNGSLPAPQIKRIRD